MNVKNGLAVLASLVLASGCGVRARSDQLQGTRLYAPNNGGVCLLAASPPPEIKYEVIGRVVGTKRSYGGVNEILPAMAFEARKIGADALINMQTGQRFKGPLPWRITSPVGDSTAIKILPDSPPLDCLQAGGKLYR